MEQKIYFASCPLSEETGHHAGRRLLLQLYDAHAGGEMPPIITTQRGKPCFSDSKWHFSISHTKRHAFCVLAGQNVGLDAEEMDRQIDLHLADKILSPPERARFDAAEDPRGALLRLWVQKEAYAKLTGRGWGSYLYETNFDPEDAKIMDGCYVAVMQE